MNVNIMSIKDHNIVYTNSSNLDCLYGRLDIDCIEMEGGKIDFKKGRCNNKLNVGDWEFLIANIYMTEKQRKYTYEYYWKNKTLMEIGGEFNVTFQAVYDSLERVKKKILKRFGEK